MKNNMKEQLIKEMAQDREFKLVQVYANHCGEDVARFGRDLVATMYDSEDVIDYVEFLEQKHAEELKGGFFEICLHIVKAEIALTYAKISDFVEYNGQKYRIVNQISSGKADEEITNQLIQKTDTYNFYDVYSRFGDKCLFYRIAEKRDPFEVEIEKAPGKMFGELSEDLQKEFLEDGDEDDIKETGKCSVFYRSLVVEATYIAPGRYTINPNSLVGIE